MICIVNYQWIPKFKLYLPSGNGVVIFSDRCYNFSIMIFQSMDTFCWLTVHAMQCLKRKLKMIRKNLINKCKDQIETCRVLCVQLIEEFLLEKHLMVLLFYLNVCLYLKLNACCRNSAYVYINSCVCLTGSILWKSGAKVYFPFLCVVLRSSFTETFQIEHWKLWTYYL